MSKKTDFTAKQARETYGLTDDDLENIPYKMKAAYGFGGGSYRVWRGGDLAERAKSKRSALGNSYDKQAITKKLAAQKQREARADKRDAKLVEKYFPGRKFSKKAAKEANKLHNNRHYR